MKVLAATLVALLLVATCSPSQAHLGESGTAVSPRDGVPTACCIRYQKRPVPRALITSVYITSSSCSQPGGLEDGWEGDRDTAG
uniref:Chemokine interleukin-8-like domain-containing protein n=1 Tax=Calidris pygmaea TaxID=425635 RepID=A0A8C3KLP3_9CHAR